MCTDSEDRAFRIADWASVDPGAPGTALWGVPMWAVLCGVVAAGEWSAFGWKTIALALIGALLSGPVIGAIGALALSLGSTLKSRIGDSGRTSPGGGIRLPYGRPDSGSDRLMRAIGDARCRWKVRFRPPVNQYSAGLVVVAAVALALAASMSGWSLVLMSGSIVWGLWLGIVVQSRSGGQEWLFFGSQVAAGWLLGCSVVGPVDVLSWALSAAIAGTWWALLSSRHGACGRRLKLSHGFQLVGVLLLIAGHAPAAGGAVLLLLMAQLPLRPEQREDGIYARRVQPLIALQLLIMSAAVGSPAFG